MRVVGYAVDGLEAVRLVKELKPDLVTMDIRMGKMNGIEATGIIMQECPCPILIVSSFTKDVVLGSNFTAIDAGALACVAKPVGFGAPDFKPIRNELISTIRAMSTVKMITRWRRLNPPIRVLTAVPAASFNRSFEVLAIAASAGGPQVLQELFRQLPSSFPLPIVVVQHIAKNFIDGLVSWLSQTSSLPIKLAEQGEFLKKGHVYFAPDNRHLHVARKQEKLIAVLDDAPAVNGFCPSATPLFQSVSKSCEKNAIGLILTGMGRDGVEGLLEMHRAGAHTISQDEASCLVYGMPGEAVASGAVDQMVDFHNMVGYLSEVLITSKL